MVIEDLLRDCLVKISKKGVMSLYNQKEDCYVSIIDPETLTISLFKAS